MQTCAVAAAYIYANLTCTNTEHGVNDDRMTTSKHFDVFVLHRLFRVTNPKRCVWLKWNLLLISTRFQWRLRLTRNPKLPNQFFNLSITRMTEPKQHSTRFRNQFSVFSKQKFIPFVHCIRYIRNRSFRI